jgi:hypothetical protein
VFGDSAIDSIRAVKQAGWSDVSLTWNREHEQVVMNSGTDFGDFGLALSTRLWV